MLSRGQLYTVSVGDTLDLDCEFYTSHFNLFENPVVWTKQQYGEFTRLNIMGNINRPFADTLRFKAAFVPSAPRYQLVLTISGENIYPINRSYCVR